METMEERDLSIQLNEKTYTQKPILVKDRDQFLKILKLFFRHFSIEDLKGFKDIIKYVEAFEKMNDEIFETMFCMLYRVELNDFNRNEFWNHFDFVIFMKMIDDAFFLNKITMPTANLTDFFQRIAKSITEMIVSQFTKISKNNVA